MNTQYATVRIRCATCFHRAVVGTDWDHCSPNSCCINNICTPPHPHLSEPANKREMWAQSERRYVLTILQSDLENMHFVAGPNVLHVQISLYTL